MTKIVLHPSSRALHHFLFVSAVIAVAVCGFVTLFFLRYGHFAPRLAATFVALTWVVVGLGWVIGSALASKKWNKTSYVLGDDYLTVNKVDLFGTKEQKMYRYDAMISLRTAQSYSGRRHDFGTIYITMPRPEHELVLPYVAEPERQAVFLKTQMARRTPHAHIESV